MAAGVSDTLWIIKDIAKLVEANDPRPGKARTFKKREA
jgi:hypothetical protein